MITCTIVVNSARTGHEDAIATVTIWNDGTGTSERGNYKYKIKVTSPAHRPKTIEDELKGFRRQQDRGAIRLVAEVLRREFPFEPDTKYARIPR